MPRHLPGILVLGPHYVPVVEATEGTSSAPAAATLSAVTSGDLDLFTEQAAKSEEVAKKQLSKDSILSLYGAGAIQQQSAPAASIKSQMLSSLTVYLVVRDEHAEQQQPLLCRPVFTVGMFCGPLHKIHPP
ncbi:hypothetical protein Celaphus_00018736 [Cervus elaphus hippelaphus]|uniref:Uncharacterized protein n=1 Tax=Cervus elaphus hippelaphus TaxID=46360 RepID=A0A212C680_CEREH|nr:hypothetical protein Celaphus_00018736 [Cervus elaphus hippelaphus]